MYVFALLGDEAEPALRRLLPELDGRVGTVRVDTAADGGRVATRGDTEYVLDDGWQASGEGLSVADALDRLTPEHDYAAVLGAPEAGTELPEIVVGGDFDDALLTVDSVDDLDVEATIEAIESTDPHETLESLVARVKRSQKADYAGAIATFTGRVRPLEGDDDDERTHYLEFEKYEGVAEQRMRDIETELEERDGVLDVRLHHRTGRIPEGDDIVFVVVLAGHREEAFRTVEDGINRLKDEVPLFKKEVTDSETFWVHERDQ